MTSADCGWIWVQSLLDLGHQKDSLDQRRSLLNLVVVIGEVHPTDSRPLQHVETSQFWISVLDLGY
jgi:hypothetical protein